MNQIIQNLSNELKGMNRKEEINELENQLLVNIEELSKNINFFNLPLKSIFSIISKINFKSIAATCSIVKILQNFIYNTIKTHFEEKETLSILNYLNTETFSLSYDETISVLSLFTNCSFLVNFTNLYKELNPSAIIKYEYEIEQKESEIQKIQKQMDEINVLKTTKAQQTIDTNQQSTNDISGLNHFSPAKIDLSTFSPIREKPEDFEPNIFKACIQGKLTSVQWLVEKQGVNPKEKAKESDHKNKITKGITPFLLAVQNGYLPLVEYLVNNRVDIKQRDQAGNYPIHIAAQNGHLPVIQYLIEIQGVDKELRGEYSKTPLHFASEKGHLPVVEYLISKGADKEARDDDGWTPLFYASYYGKYEIVKSLLSHGAKIDASDNSGKTPSDLADSLEIKKIFE